MSKTNLSDIFSDLNTESSVILPKSIKIKNIKNLDIISDATSSFMPQKGGYSDATSSFMPQKRGYLNGTKNKDINQLISMLSATSDDNYTANSTDNTEQLKNKLFNIIQSGGSPPLKSNIDSIFELIDIYKYNLKNDIENYNLLNLNKRGIITKIGQLNEDEALLFLNIFRDKYSLLNLTNTLIKEPYLFSLLSFIKYVIFKTNVDGIIYQNTLFKLIKNSIQDLTNKENTNMDILYENYIKEENYAKKEKLRNDYNKYYNTHFIELETANRGKQEILDKQTLASIDTETLIKPYTP